MAGETASRSYTSAAVGLLVRSWNVFHGRTYPETRSVRLEQMIRLVTHDAPDVVALQEVPLWALRRLERWSGMTAVFAATKLPMLGRLAGPLHRLDARHIRSALTGQANAILLRHALVVDESPEIVELNPGDRREKRVCQFVRVDRDGEQLVVANLHATADDVKAAEADLARACDALIGAGPAVVCGDFNVPGRGLPGFSPPIPGIDQILVRGLELERGPERWPEERRRSDGVLLSDHPPVEAVVE
ncbi:MAG: endonuclease/exonuclease/phosphatase family protein [Actinobacteria bacterium]|nr:MAG: endonuclease/exonuclease/phosphatase family protein [Actinomycetota bacterium]